MGLAWIKPSKKDMAVTFSYFHGRTTVMRHVARECGGISFVVAGRVAVRHLTLGSMLRPFITLTGTLFI